MKDESKILDQKQSGYPMDVRAVWMSVPGYKRRFIKENYACLWARFKMLEVVTMREDKKSRFPPDSRWS